MEDQSLLNQQEVKDYLNNLAEAVCINGESLEKYEKVITKQYGEDVYNNMKMFVGEVQEYVKRKSFTNTSKVNLGYLGKKAGISEGVINSIIKHFEGQFINDGLESSENEGGKRGSAKRIICAIIVLVAIAIICYLFATQDSDEYIYQYDDIEEVVDTICADSAYYYEEDVTDESVGF